MKIHEGTEFLNAINPAVTIGMFDGIHLGHRQLLSQTVEQACRQKGESVVVTFWPHPRIVLNKGKESLRFLTSLEEKTYLFSQLGIDHLVIIPFNTAFANLTAADFAEQILSKQIGTKHLVVGYNHRFGSDGQNSTLDYETLGKTYGFEVTRVLPITILNEPASSTTIRNYLLAGQIEKANKLLGYPYLITGRVVGGQKLGRKLNYPTANVQVEEAAKLIPLDGVYACRAMVMGKWYNGMLNIGCRPTVSTQLDHRTIEVHLFDFSQDIYSEEIMVEFIAHIRDEQKFDHVEALREQLKTDEMSARQILEAH